MKEMKKYLHHAGKYAVKNPSKYSGDASNVVYRSSWEKYAFKWCDGNSNVKSWSSEEVVIPYVYEMDKRWHRYYIDLKITMKTGETLLVEIKPEKDTVPPKGSRRTRRFITESVKYVKNMNKWDAARKYAKERGWKFHIWTENTLYSMGIMPKSTKPLEPFKRRKKKR